MFDFSGKLVLVTGAAGGIGGGLCDHFLAAGARVLAVDRDAAALDRLAACHPDAADRLVPAQADVTDRAAIAHAAGAAGATIDILINNAGATRGTSLDVLTPADWDREIAINLTAVYNCVEAVKAGMLARRRGVIVTIGSINAFTALGHPAYSAAKAGLIAYTRALATEYGPRGIRANLVCPGTVRTPAWDARVAHNPAVFENLRKWYALGDFPEPRDVALAAAFLASDAARMITGAALPVDGGLLAGNPVMTADTTAE